MDLTLSTIGLYLTLSSEEVSNKKAEEGKKRQKEGVEFAVQQLERVGYTDVGQIDKSLC